ncbi:carbohydrate ABC transporter permease [Paenibacillus beijingensis]|uniref:ABC transporter permease n=1 Tax=Paenibacillus beijingensis TaxID=1126833 RepID=A0A0D5NPN6_9BACL|nr:carbohydrate ABC transporter permease [Paenibacillus beijingensis]AJY76893.1 ABC transporter permease [Paenibacillus beijingensis]
MRHSKTFTVMQYLFAALIVFCTLSPFLWLFISSISYQKDLTAVPLRWIPKDITFERYADVFVNSGNDLAYSFRISMINSFIVSASVTLIALVIGGLAAHAIARFRFRFRQKLIYIFLFTYMIPSVVIVIPLYLLLNKAGLLDSKITLVLLDLTFAIPFVIWIMQSYFRLLSKDFYEAASIDGCSRFQMLLLIVVPLVRPGLIATGIFTFLLAWDEFFFSLLFTSSLDAKTISVAIAEFSGKNTVDYGMISTGGVLACLPPLIIAYAFQKFLVQGMTAGGVKE